MAHDNSRSPRRLGRSVKFFTDFEDQTEDETLEIPEDLSTLSDEDVTTLHTQATDAFNTIYQNGEVQLSREDLTTLSALRDGIRALGEELSTRDEANQQLAAEAAALAAEVNPEDEATEEESTEEESTEDEDAETEGAEDLEEVTAGATRQATRVNLAQLRNRRPARTPAAPESDTLTIRNVAFSTTETAGFAIGQDMDFVDMGVVVDNSLRSFNVKAFTSAAKAGRKLSQKFNVASVRKPHGDMMISDPDNQSQVEEVLKRATDMADRTAESLVASGGWCAPSETLYDIYDCGEVADGLLSLPTVGIARGGIRFNRGVGFNDLLTQAGFFYTEEQDIVGDYDGEGGGSKPCFKIPCIDFDEVRLDLEGLCLTAGLLQARGYPEVIADTIRKALIAHEIRMDSRVISSLVTQSTAVSLPADQVGAAAPILTAIELQAQHYRSSGSLGDNTVLEGIFPQWVRGVIRSDLSRRLGVDLLSVPNARITQWFTDRQISPQFVANWQSIGTQAASGFNKWPTEVDFLLYKAGTFVKGTSEVVTLEGIFDSTLLGTNDYTALFTEEGILVAKRGCDSRVVTVPICPNGNTGGGVAIDCDGSEGA